MIDILTRLEKAIEVENYAWRHYKDMTRLKVENNQAWDIYKNTRAITSAIVKELKDGSKEK